MVGADTDPRITVNTLAHTYRPQERTSFDQSGRTYVTPYVVGYVLRDIVNRAGGSQFCP
jgi:hypothetical protein